MNSDKTTFCHGAASIDVGMSQGMFSSSRSSESFDLFFDQSLKFALSSGELT